jgi:hypothetical protein
MATQHLYPLANDDRGARFELDSTAEVWRVQRMTGKKGRQETLFDENDKPLEIPIRAEPSDLRLALQRADHTPAGHFKLIPCDKSRAIVGDKCAYIKLRGEAGAVEEEERPNGPSDQALIRIVEQLARNNERMTAALAERESDAQKTIRAIVEQMGQRQDEMAKQQAELFRAIGAGAIPVAEPQTPAEAEDEPQAEPDMFQRFQQAMPMLMQLADWWRATQGQVSAASPPNGTSSGAGLGIGGNGNGSAG